MSHPAQPLTHHLRLPLVRGTILHRTTICRVNLTPLDLAERHRRRLLDLLNSLWEPLSRIARSRRSTIKPLHGAALIPPDRHREHHTTSERVAHTLVSAELGVRVRALGVAECLVHGDVLGCVLDDHAVLDVLAHDGLEDAILSRKLGDDGEGPCGVDLEAGAIEGLVPAVGVRVVAAAVLVAKPA